MDEIVKNLNVFLSDLAVFYRKLQNYHWNIKGKNFYVLHEKLEEYYDDINKQIDEVAEHILMLGFQPLGTMKDYLEKTTIEEAKNEKICDEKVFENLIEDYTILMQKANKIKRLSEEANNYGTSSMIDSYISDYHKKLWMLKSNN